VEFGHTGNVVTGAPVKLGGVRVGRVEEILLTPDRRDDNGDPLPVRMELSVDPKARAALRADAAVTVATQGPLGESYLELYTGSAKAAPLANDAVIRGVDAPRLDLVANRLAKFLESASRVLEEDPRALSTLVRGVSGLSQTADSVLTENREDIHTLASELSAAAKDVRELARLSRKTLEPGGQTAELIDDAASSARSMKQDLPQLSLQARAVLAGLSNLAGNITPEDGQRLKTAIDKYAAAGEALDQLAVRGDRVLARIEKGQGTLGGFSNDPEVYQDLKELIADLRKHPWKMLWKE
jgi:phospholipid/cholesterol/gamma-HCH transport system substrate-binding protein